MQDSAIAVVILCHFENLMITHRCDEERVLLMGET